MTRDEVYDQEALADDLLDINDTTRVYRDDPIGWAYLCMDTRCGLNASGKKMHGLSGFTTRALAVHAATEHVGAVRAHRGVIA